MAGAYPLPERVTLKGRYTRLEPLDLERRFASLLTAVTTPGEAAAARGVRH